MENIQQSDVNSNSGAEQPSQPAQPIADNGSPAEALNTEQPRVSKSVPYERFNEVYTERNRLKNEFDGYKQKYEAYEKFDQYLQQNPTAAQKLESLIAEQNQAAQQLSNQYQRTGEMPNSNDPAMQQLQMLNREIMALKAENEGAKAEKKISDYKSEFNNLIANEPESHRSFYNKFVESELIHLSNGDPISNFDLGTLKKAFNNVKESLGSLINAEKTSYVKAKQDDSVPMNRPGAAPTKEKPRTFKGPDDRAEYMLEQLRASRMTNS